MSVSAAGEIYYPLAIAPEGAQWMQAVVLSSGSTSAAVTLKGVILNGRVHLIPTHVEPLPPEEPPTAFLRSLECVPREGL